MYGQNQVLPRADQELAALAEAEAGGRLRAMLLRGEAPAPAVGILRELGVDPAHALPPAPPAPMTAMIDVMQEPARPRVAPPPGPPPKAPTSYFCDVEDCGKVFTLKQYKSAGMAMAARARHKKKSHAPEPAPEGAVLVEP